MIVSCCQMLLVLVKCWNIICDVCFGKFQQQHRNWLAVVSLQVNTFFIATTVCIYRTVSQGHLVPGVTCILHLIPEPKKVEHSNRNVQFV